MLIIDISLLLQMPENEGSANMPVKAVGVYHEGHIFAGYYGFNANLSFTFQAVKNLSPHLIYLCFRLFCKFFGHIWG